MFDRLVIVGPGLIGGSLGLAVREKRLARRVVGVGRRSESLARAMELGAVDETSLDLESAAAEADVVVLATGVERIAQQAAAVLPRMQKGALLTDVGSAKAAICRSVEKVFSASNTAERSSAALGGEDKERIATGGGCATLEILAQAVRFVGGHPMAGSERSGIASARADLFERALCVLTPTPITDPDGAGLEIVRDLWEAVGCRVREMEPEAHDRLIAQISHLPHAAAACLVNAASDEALDLAASGFLDTTRVASGEPALWVEICMANREALLAALAALGQEMNRLARALNSGDAKALEALLARAKSRRDGWVHHQGTKTPSTDNGGSNHG